MLPPNPIFLSEYELFPDALTHMFIVSIAISTNFCIKSPIINVSISLYFIFND
uniref:Uncharacterized protein n=1 Tax=Borrelia puertoricensis TaxID=2756107 RepID=A0AA51YND3_9SPIR|nr:hypothetical protein MHINFGKF_00028 [Borrelia puertoricensis]